MHRIDTPTAVGNAFNDNLAVSNPGTQVSAAWLNDVQENLCQAIEGSGIVLGKGDGGQLLEAIQALTLAVRTPVGTLGMFDRHDAPDGWLAYDGAEHLKADYPDLVALWTGEGRLIAGSTGAHFVVPNYEGYFARAASTDNTRDPSGPRDAGDPVQGHAFQSHTHTLPVRSDADSGNGFVEDSNGTGDIRSAATGSTGGATETRPVNVVFLWCGKT